MTKEHKVTNESTGGNGPMRGYTPVCSCGWRGTTAHRWQDLMHANLQLQKSQHLQQYRED